METLIELHTTTLFGSELRYFFYRNRHYFVLKDVEMCLGVSQNYVKKLHKLKQLSISKQKIYDKRQASFVINLENLLLLIGFSDTQVKIDLNKLLYTKVLPAIAKGGEYIHDKEEYEPTIEFLQNLKK